MARSDGAVVGVTVRTAAVPSLLTSGWVTFLTPLGLLEVRRAGLQARVRRRLIEPACAASALLCDLLDAACRAAGWTCAWACC